MHSAEPFVSILTPVYNGEKYLRECVESVLNQTYSNWEYIIVNNCSTDRTLEIAQSYAHRESRIRIYDRREFVGVMRNHNIAFREISRQSKYCKVVQADDWLFRNCLSEMVKVAEGNPSVGIVGSYCLDNDRVKCDGLPYPSTVVAGREICRLTLLGYLYLFWSPTSLLIRSDLIRSWKQFYGEPHLHGDDEACYEVLQRADFGFVHQILTFVRRHEDSITSSVARRVNSIMFSKLALLLKYGPVFLTPQEYTRRLNEQTRDYYRFLARNTFRLGGRKEFWRFHRDELRKIGQPLKKQTLAKEMVLEGIDILLNPKQTIRTITGRNHRIRESLGGSSITMQQGPDATSAHHFLR
jgi:glycosyltransferase involved in cell wall biosynthesis